MTANLATEWARLAIEGFVRSGVRRLVLSPGSRSTPFVLAARRHPGLELVDVIDERAGAFYALGQARMTGEPSLLLCTSGSAAANYFPAIVEASASYVPLLVATADRPPELHHCDAPQTIDQVKLYGDHVRGFFDLGPPDTSPRALREPLRVTRLAALTARWPLPGAVHVNLRAREPLGEVEPATQDELALRARAELLLARPYARTARPRMLADADALEQAAGWIARHTRGLVLAGPGPISRRRCRRSVEALTAAAGYALLAEATSQLRLIGDARTSSEALALQADGFASFLAVPELRARLRPDLVVQIGRAPVAGAIDAWLGGDDAPLRVVLTEDGAYDPSGTATFTLVGEVEDTLGRLAAAVAKQRNARGMSAFVTQLADANRLAWDAVDGAPRDGDGHTYEGAAIAEVVRRAPPESVLLLGNSLPVRLADRYVRASANDLYVLSQRGASGIDGLVAGAAGAASVTRSAVTALIGDITAFHDLSSLSLAQEAKVPLVLVVLQNFGGRIFEFLPYAARLRGEPDAMAHWTTPHERSLAGVPGLFGCAYARASNVAELSHALDAAYAAVGCTVIEVICAASGALRAAEEIDARLRATISERGER